MDKEWANESKPAEVRSVNNHDYPVDKLGHCDFPLRSVSSVEVSVVAQEWHAGVPVGNIANVNDREDVNYGDEHSECEDLVVVWLVEDLKLAGKNHHKEPDGSQAQRVDHLHVLDFLAVQENFHVVWVRLKHTDEILRLQHLELIDGLGEVDEGEYEHVVATVLD